MPKIQIFIHLKIFLKAAEADIAAEVEDMSQEEEEEVMLCSVSIGTLFV